MSDDEIGQWKEIWRHTETKRKQTELICLLVPICKVSHENFLATPTVTLWTSTLCLRSDALIVLHTFIFEVALHAESFYKHCQGSQPGSQNVENGTGKRRLGGGLIYIQDHTETDAEPEAKWKLKRNPTKNQSRGPVEGEKRAQAADFGQHGTTLTHAHMHHLMQQYKNEIQTHTPQAECGWMCRCGTQGRDRTLPGTGSSLIKLALVSASSAEIREQGSLRSPTAVEPEMFKTSGYIQWLSENSRGPVEHHQRSSM